MKIRLLNHLLKIRNKAELKTMSMKIAKLRSGFPRQNRKRRLLAAGLGLLIFLGPLTYLTLRMPEETEAAWFNDSWAYRKKLTIDETKVSGTTDLTDFPMLVKLDNDTNLRDHAQSDGDDILFTDVGGIKLDHEVEQYTSSDADLIAWVRIPTLAFDFGRTGDWHTREITNTVENNIWQHFVVTLNTTSDEIKLYKNGVEVYSNTETDDPLSWENSNSLAIGAVSDGTDNFQGLIDEVKIWNYALTADQIKRDYNFGAQFFGPSEGSP